MIFFYDKQNGHIFSTISGRVHSDDVLEMWVYVSDVPKERTGRYVIPFTTVYEELEEPVKELRVVDDVSKRVEEVVVGLRKVKKSKGMRPDVSFADLIYSFEEGKENSHDYKVVLKDGKVVDIEIKQLP